MSDEESTEEVPEGEAESGEPAGFEAEGPAERIDIGIGGLDRMITDGVPRESLILVIGGPGTGKTTFGLQFVNEALRNGERAVYFTMEQSEESMLRTAKQKGWEFGRYEEAGKLALIQMDPVEMMTNMRSIRNDLVRMVSDFGASRIVIDSVSHLEMMFDDRSERRDQIFYFSESLKETGATTLVTSESNIEDPYSSRYGIMEYTSDSVFVLRQVRTEDLRETHLAIETTKIRDTDHSREIKPFEITGDGIVVYRNATLF